MMERVEWTFEVPGAGAYSEGLEEYEVRTADDEHLGIVAALVRRAGESFVVVDAGVLPPLVHRWLALAFDEVAEIDHAAGVVWLRIERTDVGRAALALDPHKAVHAPGAEAVRVREVPGGVPAIAPGAAGPLAGASFVVSLAAGGLTAFSLFAIVVFRLARGAGGWEYALFVVPALLAALMVSVAGYTLYRAPHRGHPAHAGRKRPPDARPHTRRTGDAELIAFALGGSLLYLSAVLGLALGFGPRLPLLGWVGFGLAATIALAAGAALAVFLVRSGRTAGAEPVRPRIAEPVGVHRVLVVADEGCDGAALCRPLLAHVTDRRAELLVVAPTLVSPVRYLDSDVDAARAAAQARLSGTLDALDAAGMRARGQVGSESPLEAIADALAFFPADEIVVATPPPERTNWLEEDVVERTRALHGLSVSHLVVEQRERVG